MRRRAFKTGHYQVSSPSVAVKFAKIRTNFSLILVSSR
jgi:hypothetical protein